MRAYGRVHERESKWNMDVWYVRYAACRIGNNGQDEVLLATDRRLAAIVVSGEFGGSSS